jgi:hypothetical protein
MAARSFRNDQRGVSVVVGAILVVSLIVATTITIRVAYVPVWQSEREAAHMSVVQNQFAQLKAVVDRQMDANDLLPQTQPVSLGPASTSAFSGSPAPSQLRFETGAMPFRVYTTKMNLQSENGTSYLGADETFQSIGTSPASINITSVSSVIGLRLRIANIGSSFVGDKVTVTIKDANGLFAGEFRFNVTVPTGAWAAHVRVQNAALTTLFEGETTYPSGATYAPYYVDVLSPAYRFVSQLSTVRGPLTLTLQTTTTHAMVASYAITYVEAGPQGSAIRGGSGLVNTNAIRGGVDGRLTFQGRTSYFPAQTYTFEHGAIILDQPDGQTFAVAPSFRATYVGSTTVLSVALPALTGDAATFAGRTTIGISCTPLLRTTIIAEAPNMSLNLTTKHAGLWSRFWSDSLLALPGFVNGTHFTIQTGAQWTNLTVFGITSAPASTTYDVSLSFKQMQARIDLEE